MLKQQLRDLTTVEQMGVIAHGVNCQRVMGSGVAKALKDKWPEVYDEYMTLPSGKYMLGAAQIVPVGEFFGDLYVANVFSQEYYGNDGQRYASPEAIASGLVTTAIFAAAHSIPLYMPPIGCGLAGLSWEQDVEPIVKWVANEFDNIDIIVCDIK